MKLVHKIYLLQLVLAFVLFVFLGFTYFIYERHYKKELMQYIYEKTENQKEKVFQLIKEKTKRMKQNKRLYLSIHKRALELFKKNSHQSLAELKKQLIDEFELKNITIELYSIDKKYIVFETTYKQDMNLDLSLISDAKLYLDKVKKDKQIHLADIVTIDALDLGYLIYSYAYVKDGLYLELSFQDNRKHESFAQLFEKSNTKKETTRLFVIEKNQNYWRYYEITSKKDLDNKEKFFQNLKKFPTGRKSYNDKIIDAHLLHKTFLDFENNYAHVVTPLYDKDMFDTIGYINIVMVLDIDVAEKLSVLQRTKQIFYISIAVLAVLLLFIFFFIEANFTKKIERIVNSMKNKKTISEASILSSQDELSFVAKEYNKLFVSLQKEIKTNKVLLEENKRFIADTVHQIRTPLTNIMMNSEMIEKIFKDQKVQSFIDQINASINMLTNSYEDLAYLLSYDTFEYKVTSISLTLILKERVKFFQTISKVNFKPFETRIEDSVAVNMNSIECERLIDNNIANAIKYATPSKPIQIVLKKEEDKIILEFRSYGSEIANKEKLFEKNFRENDSKRGLGLGLNMVKIICQKYDITFGVFYENEQNVFQYVWNS